MKGVSKNTNLFFGILGLACIISGVYQTLQKNYFLGICCIIIGIGLAIRNLKEYKNHQ